MEPSVINFVPPRPLVVISSVENQEYILSDPVLPHSPPVLPPQTPNDVKPEVKKWEADILENDKDILKNLLRPLKNQVCDIDSKEQQPLKQEKADLLLTLTEENEKKSSDYYGGINYGPCEKSTTPDTASNCIVLQSTTPEKCRAQQQILNHQSREQSSTNYQDCCISIINAPLQLNSVTNNNSIENTNLLSAEKITQSLYIPLQTSNAMEITTNHNFQTSSIQSSDIFKPNKRGVNNSGKKFKKNLTSKDHLVSSPSFKQQCKKVRSSTETRIIGVSHDGMYVSDVLGMTDGINNSSCSNSNLIATYPQKAVSQLNRNNALGNLTVLQGFPKCSDRLTFCNILPKNLDNNVPNLYNQLVSKAIEHQRNHDHSIFCKCYDCDIIWKGHSKNMSNEKSKYFCEKCNQYFKKNRYLIKHNNSVHSEDKNFVCHQCCKAYTQKMSLEYHIQSKHNKERYPCNECSVVCSTKVTLRKHINRKHRSFVKIPASCDICHKTFADKSVMQFHRKTKHNKKESTGETYICNDCSSVFYVKKEIINHMKMRHLPPSYKCSQCSERFLTRTYLHRHLSDYHNITIQKKSFICETCGKSCNSKLLLYNHQLTHSNEKKFVCAECGKCFRTQSNLDQHARTHSDIRPFSCDICSKSFRIRHHLKQHMSVHGMVSTPNYAKRKVKKNLSKP